MCGNHPSSKKIGFYNRRRLSQKSATERRKRSKDPEKPSTNGNINTTASILIQRTPQKRR